VNGFQGATLVNVAGDVHGMQAALVNVAGRVRGVQLGLVNVAEDVEGVPIGLISVTESGGVHPTFWSASRSVANAGLKFATRYTYTLLSVSARREAGADLFGPGLAIGVRVPLLPGYFESDLGASYLFGGPICCDSPRVTTADDLVVPRLRMLLGVELHHHVQPLRRDRPGGAGAPGGGARTGAGEPGARALRGGPAVRGGACGPGGGG
jgi:hypothetical protein